MQGGGIVRMLIIKIGNFEHYIKTWQKKIKKEE